ncbi:MAG: hypothetical protein RJQ04_17225 [Longimicrobiales bacterium]
MARTRVTLTGVPHLMRDILSGLLRIDPGIELVEPAEEGEPGATAAPDVVIVFEASERIDAMSMEILYRRPRSRVLAVRADTGEPVLYELRPHRRALGPTTASELVAAVRTAGRRHHF